MVFASSPSTTCRSTRTNGGVDRRVPAGEHQRETLIRELCIGRSSVQPFTSTCNCAAAISCRRRPRYISITFRRATVSSHPSGFAGHPFTGQSANAEANASDSASSAAATFPCPCREKGTSFAELRRATASAVLRACASPSGKLMRSPCGAAHRRHAPGWTHLDDTVTCARATRCPGDRRIQIGHVDKIVATDLLFRLPHTGHPAPGLAIRDSHCRRSRTRLQAVRALQDARLRSVPRCSFIGRHPCACSALVSCSNRPPPHRASANIACESSLMGSKSGIIARHYNDVRNPAIWTAPDFDGR